MSILNSNEIMRFNMEQGRFQTSLASSTSAENNCCQFNPAHELFAVGNTDGIVECWDPRAPPKNVGILNCNLDSFLAETNQKTCSVTSMKFRDGLNLAVGTSTGHVYMFFFHFWPVQISIQIDLYMIFF